MSDQLITGARALAPRDVQIPRELNLIRQLGRLQHRAQIAHASTQLKLRGTRPIAASTTRLVYPQHTSLDRPVYIAYNVCKKKTV